MAAVHDTRHVTGSLTRAAAHGECIFQFKQKTKKKSDVQSSLRFDQTDAMEFVFFFPHPYQTKRPYGEKRGEAHKPFAKHRGQRKAKQKWQWANGL